VVVAGAGFEPATFRL